MGPHPERPATPRPRLETKLCSFTIFVVSYLRRIKVNRLILWFKQVRCTHYYYGTQHEPAYFTSYHLSYSCIYDKHAKARRVNRAALSSPAPSGKEQMVHLQELLVQRERAIEEGIHEAAGWGAGLHGPGPRTFVMPSPCAYAS